MGVGRGAWRSLASLDFDISSKKFVFLLSSGKKQISPFVAPLEIFLKNSLAPPLGQNPSDAHVLARNDPKYLKQQIFVHGTEKNRSRPVTSLGQQGWRRVFGKGPNFLNYV